MWHIGYVESVDGYTITVIEGNKGEAVARRNIRVGHGNIRGYARPKYANSSSKPVQPQKPTQDLDSVARDVIAGLYGNGDARRQALINAGYNPDEVQKRVNALLSGSVSTPSKTVAQVAKEVLQGKWGNGEDRKKRLEQAGYNYAQVQAEVNKLCGGSSINRAEVDRVARQVIRGDFGNGTSRRNALVRKYGTAFADAVQERVNQLL